MSALLHKWQPISVLSSDVQSGKVTATELVQRSLEAIKRTSDYNAVIYVVEAEALERASQIDERVKNGEKIGRLAGVPFMVKDNYLAKGIPTTAASNILKDYIPPYQATSVSKLEAEGAILVAKANHDSFGHGASTENSDFGPVKNPHNPDYVAGGSSGGSAAAVALGQVPFALGTDTGGSNRLPASYSGVIGYKPTYGLVSRYGVVAMASSTDTIAPLTARTEDTALVMDVMAGRDWHDSTTIERDKQPYTKLRDGVKGLNIGVLKEHMGEGVDPKVKAEIEKAIDALKERGATIKEVSIPQINLALACYYIIIPAEVSSNLGRYDGIRYGYSSSEAKSLDEVYSLSRSHGFNAENKRRILIGTYVLSSGYYDAYYKKAQQVRTVLIEQYHRALKDVDVLVGPTAPSTAVKLGENTSDPLKMYLLDIMTVSMSLVGVPAISVPVGMIDGLPVGFQISAAQRADNLVMSVAKEIEKAGLYA